MTSFNMKFRARSRLRCYLCGEEHEFLHCPNIPEGILPDEERRLFAASRDRNEDLKVSVLNKVLLRLDHEAAARGPPPPAPGRATGWYATIFMLASNPCVYLSFQLTTASSRHILEDRCAVPCDMILNSTKSLHHTSSLLMGDDLRLRLYRLTIDSSDLKGCQIQPRATLINVVLMQTHSTRIDPGMVDIRMHHSDQLILPSIHANISE